MRAVAECAGVSVTTVSQVINETRPVSDELRRRVLTAMDELGYQPNRLARSLRRGQTHTIVFREDTTCFQGFQEEGTRLRVLAPEWDIDGHYLGPEKLHYLSLLDRYPEPDDYESLLSMAEDMGTMPKSAATMEIVDLPPNISQTDFGRCAMDCFTQQCAFTRTMTI